MAYHASVGFWDKVKGAFGREATDVTEGLKDLGQSLDEALAEKERELAATPAERFDMALEDADETNRRLEDLVARTERGDANGIKRPDGGPSGAPAGHQLLDPDDVTASPYLGTALKLVTVEATQAADPMCTRCGHSAWLDERAGKLIGEEKLPGIAMAVEEHPLVNEVVYEDAEVLYVRAPALHHEDVRLLVAAAMAANIPDGWRTVTPPDLSA